MSSTKFDGRKLVALVDVILDAVISIFSAVYRMVTRSERPSEPEVASDAKKKKRRIIATVSILAIICAISSLFLTEWERFPKPNLEPHLALGQVMAEETAKLLGDKGEVMVVTMYQKPEFKNTVAEACLKAFRKTLSRKGGITVLTTETPRNENPRMESAIEEFPASLFFSILEKHPNISVIASFAGPPMLTDEEIAGWGKKLPKVVVYSTFGTGLKECFDREIVQVAIIRRGKIDMGKKPGTQREWFDQNFEVVTTEPDSSPP